jgi:hypothetical protein
MSFSPSILEGSVSAKPFAPMPRPSVSGSLEAPVRPATSGDVSDSPENAAVAELGGLISSLGSLSSQAQSLPLSAPTLPGLPQGQSYRPQATDYTQLADDSN